MVKGVWVEARTELRLDGRGRGAGLPSVPSPCVTPQQGRLTCTCTETCTCMCKCSDPMRTTIELTDLQRAKLLELAAQRREKGFSGLVQEAVDRYLAEEESRSERISAALAL